MIPCPLGLCLLAGRVAQSPWPPEPSWLLALADLARALAGLSAAHIAWDILTKGRRMMPVMKWVWPVSALYMGPLAILAYRRLQLKGGSREPSGAGHRLAPQAAASLDDRPADVPSAQLVRQRTGSGKDGAPQPAQVFVAATHCGAGCTLGDIAGEFSIFALGVTLFGSSLWPQYVADYALAYLLGILFQYYSIAPMRGISGWAGVVAAAKADTLSLTAFEVGLFGWMAITSFLVFPHGLQVDSPIYWLMMQIGMCLGFVTSLPVNWLLLRAGIKEPM